MNNKKIFILGASSDIGFETVNKFLKEGWIVYAHYNSNKKKLQKIKSPNLKLIHINLKDIKKFEKILKNKKFDEIDSFISLTGLIVPTNFFKINFKSFIDQICVNYFSNILVMQRILPLMLKRKFGRILLSSSVGVKFGGGNNSLIYSLTKYMNEFFFSVYKNFSSRNILINTLRIGVTDTKIHKKKKNNLKQRVKLIPIKRMASVLEVAEYLYFYGSEQNTLSTNSIIEITGGE